MEKLDISAIEGKNKIYDEIWSNAQNSTIKIEMYDGGSSVILAIYKNEKLVNIHDTKSEAFNTAKTRKYVQKPQYQLNGMDWNTLFVHTNLIQLGSIHDNSYLCLIDNNGDVLYETQDAYKGSYDNEVDFGEVWGWISIGPYKRLWSEGKDFRSITGIEVDEVEVYSGSLASGKFAVKIIDNFGHTHLLDLDKKELLIKNVKDIMREELDDHNTLIVVEKEDRQNHASTTIFDLYGDNLELLVSDVVFDPLDTDTTNFNWCGEDGIMLYKVREGIDAHNLNSILDARREYWSCNIMKPNFELIFDKFIPISKYSTIDDLMTTICDGVYLASANGKYKLVTMRHGDGDADKVSQDPTWYDDCEYFRIDNDYVETTIVGLLKDNQIKVYSVTSEGYITDISNNEYKPIVKLLVDEKYKDKGIDYFVIEREDGYYKISNDGTEFIELGKVPFAPMKVEDAECYILSRVINYHGKKIVQQKIVSVDGLKNINVSDAKDLFFKTDDHIHSGLDIGNFWFDYVIYKGHGFFIVMWFLGGKFKVGVVDATSSYIELASGRMYDSIKDVRFKDDLIEFTGILDGKEYTYET